MTLREALALAREMEEATNYAVTQNEIQRRTKKPTNGMWPNDWPHDFRATTTDGSNFLTGFHINDRLDNGMVISSYDEVDGKEEWLKRYGYLYPERTRRVRH